MGKVKIMQKMMSGEITDIVYQFPMGKVKIIILKEVLHMVYGINSQWER